MTLFYVFTEIYLWLNRLSKLVDEEIEADEEFWGQDAFKEVRFCDPIFLDFDQEISSVVVMSSLYSIEVMDALRI